MGKIAYRQVSPDWAHPIDSQGYYIPLFNGACLVIDQDAFQVQKTKWEEEGLMDVGGELRHWIPIPMDAQAAGFEAIVGTAPDPKNYMPVWKPEEATAWQVYKEVTEGTPISVVYSDLNTMARTIAEECGHSFMAMKEKIVFMLKTGKNYPVKEFEIGGRYYQPEEENNHTSTKSPKYFVVDAGAMFQLLTAVTIQRPHYIRELQMTRNLPKLPGLAANPIDILMDQVRMQLKLPSVAAVNIPTQADPEPGNSVKDRIAEIARQFARIQMTGYSVNTLGSDLFDLQTGEWLSETKTQ